ncbi:flagellar export chaperone FlgN [Pengzhenrongella sicca]|uniref:Flagellar export chaperone FlgN n=1 Tax=Pengzhenrongella sicca TaxID=2819238 RepID=A0A8A4ZEL4_9MICO|nr:flagellar export chaperone FlgN [Pengzhenrongella sicca]QTE29851.1 flagellar export chaperone FlgN [Pengzhenrongella sicca]
MGVAELSAVLWRERQLLELLLFKLEEEQLVLSSGRTRWLGHATREVEQVLDQIRDAELGRAIEADVAALAYGVAAGSGLLALAEAAPEPWKELLMSHREAFVSLTSQIQDVAQGNRALLTSSHRAAQETILGLQETMQTYDPRGSTSAASPAAMLLDQSF